MGTKMMNQKATIILEYARVIVIVVITLVSVYLFARMVLAGDVTSIKPSDIFTKLISNRTSASMSYGTGQLLACPFTTSQI